MGNPKIPISMVIREHYMLFTVIPAVLLGKWLDDNDTLKMTRFRDKSALYGGQVKPGDPPSWP